MRTAEDQTAEERYKLIQVSMQKESEFLTTEDPALIASTSKKKKIIKWSIIGGIVLVILVLAIVLPIVLIDRHHDDPHVDPVNPIPYYNPYTLDQASIVRLPASITGIIEAPATFSSDDHMMALRSVVSRLKDGHPLKKGIDSRKILSSNNNKFIKKLNFTFAQPQWKVSHLVITDHENERFSVPEAAVNKPTDNLDMRLDMTGFKMNTDGSFGFSFSDPLIADSTFINTSECTLVFMDKFIQMDFNLPSQRLFGFGERIHEFALKEGAWNMWAQGQPNPYDDGSGRKGEYGVHPFLLVQSKNPDDFFGVYFRNANAMTPIITFNDDGTSKLSFITIGGQLEIFFFIHGTVTDVVKKYQEFMGARPKLPPFWALGWMQTSYKWSTQAMVEDALMNYRTQGYPLDAIFLDIPYMDNYVDFTVNQTAFQDIGALADDLHANNQHLIPIIDAAVSAEDTKNKYYKMGDDDDIFIKSTLYQNATYHNNLVNQVWPKLAVFVDWFNDNCTKMWHTGLSDLYDQAKFDGIWIDMNEPWGFQTAEVDPANPKVVPVDMPRQPKALLKQEGFLEDGDDKDYTWYRSFESQNESTWYLPFMADFENYQSYDNNTISLNATNPSMNTTQYNLHSFYGHMMAKRTWQYFDRLPQVDSRKDKRNFILTRSTFTGAGQWASHWTGDNYREYAYMNYSISGIMNFQMFGIPHIGADVCGFFGKGRDDKLCAKWAQLATFYPMARFHYDIHSDPNEPYLMDEPYKSIVKRTMFDRYQYLRHLYTCLFEMSKNGGTCFDPLFYYFPTDQNLYNEIESSFVFAGALKVTPSLTNTTEKTVASYFPEANGKWVSLTDLNSTLSAGTHNLDITQQQVNVHMMPGKVIGFQNNSDATINRVHQLVNAPIQLLVNLDNNGYAKGTLFLDGGESLSELNNYQYEYYNFHVSQKSIQVQLQEGNRGSQNGYNLASIKFLNAESLKDNTVACALGVKNNLAYSGMTVSYIESEKALLVTADTNLHFSEIHSIHISTGSELNVCSREHFKYAVKDGQVIDLEGKTSVDIPLMHVGNALPDITATLRILEGNIINVKWTWTGASSTGKRPYEVPDEYITTNNKPLEGDLSKYVKVQSNPFTVSILSEDQDQTEVFGLDGMIYDDYLNWVKVHVNTEKADKFTGIFGLGERASFDFFYKDGVYSMWSKDIPTPIETGDLPASNMYGTHPYFMYKHKTNSWVGVLYKLAAAQDWWIKNDQVNGQVNIQTIAVGGMADIYIMMGQTPDSVITKYNTIIGNPVLLPQWALGWNQCRYGYRDLQALENVLTGYRTHDFPLDVMWSDIDYMSNYRNFIYDETLAFKGLPDFVTRLHNQGMKYVPILDAGTAARPLQKENYPEYLDGEKRGVFMTVNNETFIGQVWPNDAAYPDMFDHEGTLWWQENLGSMHKLLGFDGLWLDMNEASNFCVGACYQRQKTAKSVQSMLKYIPTGKDLETQSMPLDTKHKDGNISLDTHSLYGIQEIKITHEWFTSIGSRTFIIERSSFAGMGKYGSRWLGDNFSEDKFMKLSVSGVMLMSMFGIPLSGADICGFLGNTNEALCTKWHFVGALYPFSRNHNGGQLAQEPYVWSDIAQGHMRDAIKLKYSLIRYYYTNLMDLSQTGVGTFYKPLFFEFPEDMQAMQNIENNIMLGSALKASINSGSLSQAMTDFYFPAGLWCRLRGNITNTDNCFQSAGEVKNFPSGLSDYQIHLREGYIVPMQNASAKLFNTSLDLQSWPVEFNVLGHVVTEGQPSWSASGRYINDDGENLDLNGTVNSYTLSATSDGTIISVKIAMDQQATKKNNVDGCISVNKNDFIQGISFHNAKIYKLDAKYDVTINFKPELKIVNVKVNAGYDEEYDRLYFSLAAGSEICMSTISEITLQKSQ